MTNLANPTTLYPNRSPSTSRTVWPEGRPHDSGQLLGGVDVPEDGFVHPLVRVVAILEHSLEPGGQVHAHRLSHLGGPPSSSSQPEPVDTLTCVVSTGHLSCILRKQALRKPG